MKKARQTRKLRFETLEAKAAPSSVWLVTSVAESLLQAEISGNDSVDTAALDDSGYSHQTEQILRYIEEHSSCERQSIREVTRPSEEQCVAVDEMMQVVAAEWSSLFVLSFYDPGSEL